MIRLKLTSGYFLDFEEQRAQAIVGDRYPHVGTKLQYEAAREWRQGEWGKA